MNSDSPNFKTQVLIIGAGPTGLSMAMQLLRYGIDFIILEKNNTITTLSKALVVQARTLEIFEEIGLAQKAIDIGQITPHLSIFKNGKNKVSVNLSGLGKSLSQYPFVLSLEQSKTEGIMLTHLLDNSAKVFWNAEFVDFEKHKDRYRIQFRDENKDIQIITADYIFGADGPSSPLRHKLTIAFSGTTVAKLFYVADVKINSSEINKKRLYGFLIKKGFILFFPMFGKGNYRIIGMLPEGKQADSNIQFIDLIPYLKEQIALPLEFVETRWFSTYKVHSRLAEHFHVGKCFIGGDAAHIHTPAGGQGMNTGIQDAYNLAWKIAFVLKGKLKAEILETYTTERRANGLRLLKTTDRMFNIMAGTNPIYNFVRLYIFPFIAQIASIFNPLKKRFFPFVSQIGIEYPGSSLTIPGKIADVNAGVRMPYIEFSNGSSIFDYINEPEFKLLYFGAINMAKFKDLPAYKFSVLSFNFEEVPKSVFKDESNFYILLRPDNHIAYIGKNITIAIGFLNSIQSR